MSTVKKIKTTEQRWDEGIPHDPRSYKLVKAMQGLDYEYNKGCMDIKLGGDGDNGEELMYLLDIYFELHPKADV